MLEDKSLLIPGEEGRKSLEVARGIYKSSELGRLVNSPIIYAHRQNVYSCFKYGIQLRTIKCLLKNTLSGFTCLGTRKE
jgi:hypothetical protein